MIDQQLENSLRAARCTVTPCGSRVTCRPEPVLSDYDYLVFCPDARAVSQAVSIMSSHGFLWEGSEHYQNAEGSEHYQNAAASGFMSWRGGEVNLIVTRDPGFAARHAVATKLCSRLNLMDKQDRIAVFQAVLYAKEWGTMSDKLFH